MASYWAAYYGTALVLNENEFEDFKEKYNGIHKVNLDEIFEDMPVQEYEFVRSKNINLSNGDPFPITEVNHDDCDGMYLIPYVEEDDPDKWSLWRTQNVYAVFSDKNMNCMAAFKEKRYESYEALVDEYKEKLLAYLPEDFDWDHHIGQFSYAAFA